MELKKELVKFASANNLSKGSRLLEVSNDEVNKYMTGIRLTLLIDRFLLGVIKTQDETGGAICKTNPAPLVEEKYKGGTFARSFDIAKLSRSLEPYSELIGYGNGMQTMTVMLHPQGYTQNAKCNYFIGNTLNLLNGEGATTGELIYFAYKLGTGLSSQQLEKKEVNIEEIKCILDSVLGPWFTMITLEKSGFCEWDSPRGMYVSHIIIDKINEFKLETITNFNDLISIKEENFVWNTLKYLREQDSEMCELFEKFTAKARKLSCRYGCDELYLFKLLKETIADKDLKEIKSLASDIRREDKEMKDQYCGKPTRVKAKSMNLF